MSVRNSRSGLDSLSSASFDRTSRYHSESLHHVFLNLNLKPCQMLEEEHVNTTPVLPSGTLATNIQNIRRPISNVLLFLCCVINLHSLPLSTDSDSACWVMLSQFPILSQRWAMINSVRWCWSFQPKVSLNGCFFFRPFCKVTVTQRQRWLYISIKQKSLVQYGMVHDAFLKAHHVCVVFSKQASYFPTFCCHQVLELITWGKTISS